MTVGPITSPNFRQNLTTLYPSIGKMSDDNESADETVLISSFPSP
mgnify:CR=1 FL=1